MTDPRLIEQWLSISEIGESLRDRTPMTAYPARTKNVQAAKELLERGGIIGDANLSSAMQAIQSAPLSAVSNYRLMSLAQAMTSKAWKNCVTSPSPDESKRHCSFPCGQVH